jgi:L-lactate dehydrogenase complex protein LldG
VAERAAVSGTEHGDRTRFLAGARRQLRRPVPHNVAHPAPTPDGHAPRLRYTDLDPDDLLGSFRRSAAVVGSVVHTTPEPEPPVGLLRALVEQHGIERAVISDQSEALAVGEQLDGLGVLVSRATVAASADADLGVTSATALVAATGSLVLRSASVGSRSVSVLPRVHLCAAPAGRLVGTPGDVLRALSGHQGLLPSNLTLVTGPSRTGDIEQLLTIGVHGPVAVEVVVTACD